MFQNLQNHKHNKIAEQIKNITISATILSLSLIINLIHIPLSFGVIEGEKIEFGLIIAFSLFGIIKWKILATVVGILPFLDQINHGHHVLFLVPFESFANIIILGLTYFVWKLLIHKCPNKLLTKVSYCLICACIVFFIKYPYFKLIFKIMFEQGQEHDHHHHHHDVAKELTPKQRDWDWLARFFGFIAGIKFLLIISISLLIKKWIKPITT